MLVNVKTQGGRGNQDLAFRLNTHCKQAAFWFMAGVSKYMFDLGKFNSSCQSFLRGKTCLHCLFLFLSLHDYSPLRWSNTANIIKDEGREGKKEMRGSSASIFEEAKANGSNDLDLYNAKNLITAAILQGEGKKKKKCSFFSIGQCPIHLNRMPSD